jgi:hypothetical protein
VELLGTFLLVYNDAVFPVLVQGVFGGHQEFGYLDGSPGSRVTPGWGFRGLGPAEDCADHFIWHGYGTFMASLCCGKQLGAAKNATIHSGARRQRAAGGKATHQG